MAKKVNNRINQFMVPCRRRFLISIQDIKKSNCINSTELVSISLSWCRSLISVINTLIVSYVDLIPLLTNDILNSPASHLLNNEDYCANVDTTLGYVVIQLPINPALNQKHTITKTNVGGNIIYVTYSGQIDEITLQGVTTYTYSNNSWITSELWYS